jgi:peptidoglycan/LPS O-acetylase OafA/YrhL
MLLRIIPFILGILLGKFSYNNKKIKYYIIIFILGLLSFLLVRFDLIYNRLFLFMFNLSIMFFIILIIDIINKKKDFVIKPFSFLGKYSLEIYLVHVAIRKIITTYSYPNYKIGYYLLFIIVSIIISILFNTLIKKVLRIKK